MNCIDINGHTNVSYPERYFIENGGFKRFVFGKAKQKSNGGVDRVYTSCFWPTRPDDLE